MCPTRGFLCSVWIIEDHGPGYARRVKTSIQLTGVDKTTPISYRMCAPFCPLRNLGATSAQGGHPMEHPRSSVHKTSARPEDAQDERSHLAEIPDDRERRE